MSNNNATLERSIFNTDPLDEFACVVADFICKTAGQHPNIEIEAKLGRLIHRETNERVQLPVLSETLVHIEDINARFESSMTSMHHEGYNKLLNDVLLKSNSKTYRGSRVSYKHLKETDYFYSLGEGGGVSGKLRVTRDEKTGKIKEDNGVIVKKTLANLNVYCPQGQFDYRISVNVETPVDPPPEEATHEFMRYKDRVSYAHQEVQIDLTQVFANSRDGARSYELEVEFRNANTLLDLAKSSRFLGNPTSQDWSPYEDLVLIFLNNVRLLIKNCPQSN